MCDDWLRGFRSTGAFLDHVKERAVARRGRDGPVASTSFEGGEPGTSPAVGKRGGADLCYAYRPHSGDFYVGYSGYAGGMTYRQPETGVYKPVTLSGGTDQSDRRVDRLGREIDDPQSVKGTTDRPRCNCAEACALSIANSWNRDGVLRDLVFVTFYPDGQGGKVKSPCEKCMGWIKGARSYCDGKETFHCRMDDDPGSGSPGSSSEKMIKT